MFLLSANKNSNREITDLMLFLSSKIKMCLRKLFPLSFIVILFANQCRSQGTWTPVYAPCPDTCGGVMLLLTDGSVIVKTLAGPDIEGNVWDKLSPDTYGSYANGTWSTIAPMQDTRTFFSSQILKDGRVYVAGGEYGTGMSKSEIYDPLTDSWMTGPSGVGNISDANSEMMPDGRVLQALIDLDSFNMNSVIYDPATNTYLPAPTCWGEHNETSWVKLPDNSILFIDRSTTYSERYIPSLNQWVDDGILPFEFYDTLGAGETGPGFLLPDGRAFFIGDIGKTAYYTPSGTVNPGTWAAGPDIPDSLGASDAAGAMMINGNILCALSPMMQLPVDFYSPTYFFEFNYLTNTFTPISAPDGNVSMNNPCFYTNMLDLPDGTVLFGNLYDPQYYIYTPSGTPLASGKPTINDITSTDCNTFFITGTLFNGISVGAAYGDDWQMSTNYPIVRLTSGSNVYYARTSNWNRNGLQTGTLPDTAEFTLPPGLPSGTYSLVVVANGISSSPVTFSGCTVGVNEASISTGSFTIYPNPFATETTITFNEEQKNVEIKITDIVGKEIKTINFCGKQLVIAKGEMKEGIYFVLITNSQRQVIGKRKIIIQ